MGKFIVFEGIDGAGKTTQIKLLAEWLNQNYPSQKVITTNQPGGTQFGKELRNILLNSDYDICECAELLLFAADRAEHCKHIRKWLYDGAIVLCDRFTASTVAYQGYGMGIDLEVIKQINEIATDGFKPDLTIFLELDVETVLSRISDKDRIERRGIDFYERIYNGYLSMSIDCCQTVDAGHSVDAIATEIREIVKTIIFN